MGRIFDIRDGWAKYLTGIVTDEELRRKEICINCSLAIEGTYEKLMPDFSLKEVQGLKCNECHCPLSTAIRSKNHKCPLGKW